jgi:MFS family permease
MDSPNTRGYRISVVAILTLGMFINAIDRLSLSIAVPTMIKEFGIDTATMGVALSAFFWAYAIGNAPGGNLADKYGSKTVLGWSAFVWSAFSAFTGFAQNVYHVIFARFGVGIGEAGSMPTSMKVIAGNFPSHERATAVAVSTMGIRIGNAVAPILMAYLIVHWGWRAAFIITGLGSMLWVVLWYFHFTDLSEIKAKKAGPKEKITIPWKVILTNRALLGLTAVKFTQDFLQWLFLTWVPGYLVLGRGFSVIAMGFYISLSYAVAAVAQPFVGYISDWLIVKGWSVNRARKTVQVTLQILSSTIIITGFTDSVPIAMFFMVLAISAESICAGQMWTIITEVVPPRLVGSIGGLINGIGAIAGILSPIVTGVVVKVTGSFALALLMGGSSILLAAVVLVFVVPELKILQSLDSKIPQLADDQLKA